jgi:site-specific DNA recombinase
MGIKTPAKQTETPYAWSARTVADILAKVEYPGHTVNFKTRKKILQEQGEDLEQSRRLDGV